ncbi:MAG: DNA-deoxyinosine glycosylase [Alphaproteobacteria bacterium]|nr:DNA-deoxyinosine glycosylase [Alphaproteobacteria bacterium]
MIHCFAPWTDENTRAVIVGTMPSAESLRQQMYYAHPQNRFWRYMAYILNAALPVVTAAERRTLLLRHGIGLWDALAACERDGSLDSAIKNAIPNDFRLLPNVKFYIFNGQKAFLYFKKYNGGLLCDEQPNYAVLPSTSPANASIPEQIKLEIWKQTITRIKL